MIEEKLLQAAKELPEAPECFYEIMEQTQNRKKNFCFFNSISKKAVVACMCIFLLTCGTVFAATTETKYAGWPDTSCDFKSVMKTAGKMDIILPETLGGYSFKSFTSCRVVPDGTSYLKVLLGTPSYLWHCIDYSLEGNGAFSESAPFHLYIGSTENALYQYFFYFDDHNTWISEYLLPDTYHTESYKGILLQSGIVNYEESDSEDFNNRFYEIIWMDDAHKTVFMIHCYIPDMQDFERIKNQITNYAKDIIDSNIS